MDSLKAATKQLAKGVRDYLVVRYNNLCQDWISRLSR